MKASEHHCFVQSHRMLTPSVFELTFKTQESLVFEAGQFVSLLIPESGPQGHSVRRAYSIASPPENNEIQLCIKIVENGPGTQYLFQLRPNDSFKMFAPYGTFTYKTPVDRHVCFVATGTGVAPFRSMLLSQKYRHQLPRGTMVLLGVRTEDELLYEEEMQRMTWLKRINAVSQPKNFWSGFRGRVTDLLKECALDWENTDFYLCGNGAMIQDVKNFLLGKNVEKNNIFHEKYY